MSRRRCWRGRAGRCGWTTIWTARSRKAPRTSSITPSATAAGARATSSMRRLCHRPRPEGVEPLGLPAGHPLPISPRCSGWPSFWPASRRRSSTRRPTTSPRRTGPSRCFPLDETTKAIGLAVGIFGLLLLPKLLIALDAAASGRCRGFGGGAARLCVDHCRNC